ncbi:uncharacterized protein LOC141607484 [Silene latifolia]|uniref:uncharacterized protein LOC141607484 n=1 Tax=Silene latifolia TaxID=37657 RepID=UPI003D785130
MTVSPNVTPDNMVNSIVQPRLTNAVTFSDEDLPPFGPQHNLALYIAIICRNKHIPMTLVDNGSALNVLPLKTAHILGLEKNDFIPTNQTVRAFDGTVRRVSGLVNIMIRVGFTEREIICQVIDVASSFNLLLGRPWIHAIGAVSSTLHRKIKIPFKGEVITINATPIVVDGGDITYEVRDNSPNNLCGFEVVNTIELNPKLENVDLYTNSRVCEVVFKTGKNLGLSLYPRREDKFEVKLPMDKGMTFGLGYKPTERDYLKKKRLKLSAPICRFSSSERLLPGIEIFQDCYYIPEDILTVMPAKTKSAPITDNRALSLLFREENRIEILNQGLVNMILRTEREGKIFNPDDETVSESESESEFESESSPKSESKESSVENTLSPVFPSHAGISGPVPNTPIPQLNSDHNDIENEAEGELIEDDEEVEPPPQLVKGLEEYDQRSSVIEDTETINMGTLVEPKELKIGTTLDPEERRGFINLRGAFKDVIAWSYKDMPGIDREIAEHKIPIKPGFKPVKQKLRRMRTEWSLKVKEEIDK